MIARDRPRRLVGRQTTGTTVHLLVAVVVALLAAFAAAVSYSLTAANSVGTSNIGENKYTANNIPLAVTNVAGGDSDGTPGKANNGDSIAVTFNAALNPSSVPSTGTITLTGGSNQTTITITGLTPAGGFTINGTNYEKNGHSSSASVSFSLSNRNQTVTATISSTFSSAGNVQTGSAQTFTFTPASTITNTYGTAASGSYTTPSPLLLF